MNNISKEDIIKLLEETSVQSDSSSNDMIILGDDFAYLADELVNLFAPIAVGCCKEQLVCEHRWCVNTHRKTKYCMNGCDGFKEQAF